MSDWTLSKHPTFPAVSGPVVVCVMDGVGIGRGDSADAVAAAQTPNLDWLRDETPTTALEAHGLAAGMPSDDDMGNSEVGHNHLGAGRIFSQGATLVSEAVRSGRLFDGPVWRELVGQVARTGEPLHLIGLLSDGNVHSHVDHLAAMLRRADTDGVERARVHVLLDGRIVRSGGKDLALELEEKGYTWVEQSKGQPVSA